MAYTSWGEKTASYVLVMGTPSFRQLKFLIEVCYNVDFKILLCSNIFKSVL